MCFQIAYQIVRPPIKIEIAPRVYSETDGYLIVTMTVNRIYKIIILPTIWYGNSTANNISVTICGGVIILLTKCTRCWTTLTLTTFSYRTCLT